MQVKTRQTLQVLCISVTVQFHFEDLLVAVIGILEIESVYLYYS